MRSIQYGTWAFSHIKPVTKSTHLNRLAIQLEEGNGTPLQYSCLENPMDRGAW